MCEKCGRTGKRLLTQEEMDQVLESCDPGEAHSFSWCECEKGRAQQRAFWYKAAPAVAAEVANVWEVRP